MTRNRKRKRKLLWLFIPIIIFALFADSAWRLKTEEYELKYTELPPAFNGYRIVQLSDLHTAVFGEHNDTLVNAVRKANPNIIAITGDMLDGDGQFDYVHSLIPRLTAIAPVYYVSGNHEWAARLFPELFELLEGYGVTCLRNSYVTIRLAEDEIVLAGIDDPNGPSDQKSPERLAEEIRAAEGDKFTVLLAHRNEKTELYNKLGLDLVICGHGHGGMIRLPFTDGLIDSSRTWFPSYTDGVYTLENTTLIVSRGVGNHTGVPRLLNNPHIVVAVLRQSP